MAVAVLNVNNIRDIESDKKARKMSIPVRLGRRRAVYYQAFLFSGSILASIFYMIIHFEHFFQFIFLFTLPLFLLNLRELIQKTQPQQLDPSLKKLSLSILLFTILYGIGLNL
jgi:1,4-dihydroxy-2-naphthoate octaprenyltransferase